MKRLYIDIDGVLLTKKNIGVPEYGREFLKYLVNNFDCYWLTTHCRGDSLNAIQYLSSFYEKEIIEELNKVKSTNWDALKTEGIDLSTDFYWLDDYPFNAEKIVLEKNNLVERLIIVDLDRSGELERIKCLLPTPAEAH
ncbi:MAG: hypothetical protein COW65_13130 [Cytophagales bacterium CG18_big_fil_WC_8_21_14_2_50_42_9]|nr:MAG: hypothetical protein COW65_13130 [Cytophagales bacterium CG18_big_fil_WC_8_21_14_2_50_42_9]